MNLAELIAAIPEGSSRARFRDEPYAVSKNTHNNGRSCKIYAEELGGNDFISLNFYHTEKADLLKPCEMPEQKVVEFLCGMEFAS
jgi:hypothetical protein